ncbi:MAG: hypothetical protein AB1Z51_02475 [Desulfuromonadales bacterium]
MQVYFVVLIFFLLAFSGLAAGLLLKRKGLRGGCGHGQKADQDCQCHPDKTAAKCVETSPPAS